MNGKRYYKSGFRRKIGLKAVLGFWWLFFAVFAYLVILPQWDGLRIISREFIFQKKAENFFARRLEDFSVFQKNRSSYGELMGKINSSFVQKEAPIKFIEFLEKEAKSQSLPLEILPLSGKVEKGDLWQPLFFKISLKGPFPKCLVFLERLEKGPFLVKVFQLDIKRVREEELRLKRFEGLKKGDVFLEIKIKVFTGQELPKSKKPI